MSWCKCITEDSNKYLGMVNLSMIISLWIDSDIVFDTNKFWQLCDLAVPIAEDGGERRK